MLGHTRIWGIIRDKSICVNGCELIIPAGEYPSVEAICAGINSRCGKDVCFPAEPKEGNWILDFDNDLLTELRAERRAILLRQFDAMDEMVEPGVLWTVHDLSAYVPTREVM